MNESIAPHGLVPSLLVFGVFTKLPNVSPRHFPRQKERMRVAQIARQEYERIVSRSLVQSGTRSIQPPAASLVYAPGDFAYVFPGGLKHCTNPHLIASADGKCAGLRTGERSGPRPFNLSQSRPALVQRHCSYDKWLSELSDELGIVLHTEIIRPGDSRKSLFGDAKHNEILGLIQKGTFRLVPQSEAGESPNIIPSR